MRDIRLVTLSTVMLDREDLEQGRLAMLYAAVELPMSDELLKERIARVANALSSITTHAGVQAIACAETVEEAPSEPAVAHPPEIERLIDAAIEIAKRADRFNIGGFLAWHIELCAALDAVRPGWREKASY